MRHEKFQTSSLSGAGIVPQLVDVSRPAPDLIKGSVVEKPKYPQQYLMRKNRIIKLQSVKCRCEICHSHAQLIHHIDRSLDNHSLDNLLAVCAKCHRALHHPDKVDAVNKTSKYIRLYGATMVQICKRTGFSTNKIYEMHERHELKAYLSELIATQEYLLANKT